MSSRARFQLVASRSVWSCRQTASEIRRFNARSASLRALAFGGLRCGSTARPGVSWATWVTAMMWIAWLSWRLPRGFSAVPFLLALDASIGAVPL